jgi:hypothetical protein
MRIVRRAEWIGEQPAGRGREDLVWMP